jgi:hypothetical protein
MIIGEPYPRGLKWPLAVRQLVHGFFESGALGNRHSLSTVAKQSHVEPHSSDHSPRTPETPETPETQPSYVGPAVAPPHHSPARGSLGRVADTDEHPLTCAECGREPRDNRTPVFCPQCAEREFG